MPLPPPGEPQTLWSIFSRPDFISAENKKGKRLDSLGMNLIEPSRQVVDEGGLLAPGIDPGGWSARLINPLSPMADLFFPQR